MAYSSMRLEMINMPVSSEQNAHIMSQLSTSAMGSQQNSESTSSREVSTQPAISMENTRIISMQESSLPASVLTQNPFLIRYFNGVFRIGAAKNPNPMNIKHF